MSENSPLKSNNSDQHISTDENAKNQDKQDYKLSDGQLKEMETGPEGISDGQAKERFNRDGPNEINEKKKNSIIKFLSHFWGPIPIVLWVAIALEISRLSYLDFVILMILQIFNGIVVWYEERSAGNAIEALKKGLASKAKVKRDNKWATVEARELVIGDRVNIKLGDVIPADCRLGPGSLEIDQSALTGESLAVTKSQNDIVYQSSICKRGDIEAIVANTGPRTYYGKISALVGGVESKGNIDKIILKFTLILVILGFIITAVIFIVVMAKGGDVLESLSLCLVILISVIPIAAQVVSTVVLTIGAHELIKHKAIARKLSAIEEMAGIQILLSDKTGTLTKNKLKANPPFLLANFTENDIFLYAALASKRQGQDQDAIDKCIIESAKENYDINLDKYKETNFVPFDPENKRTESSIKDKETGEKFKCTKGAPQVIIELSQKDKIKDEITSQVDEMAARGFRTIGVALAKENDDNWKIVGLIPLYDPPREDTKETIKKALEMNLKVKMITGDSIAIAKEVARELDLGDNIYKINVFKEAWESGDKEKAYNLVENADGFAEVFPEHKYQICEVFQNKGYTVAMTGDGVNDAPALKKANVGVAVEGSTDAARASASIVLTKPGLSVIIRAIYTARMIFQRMNNYFMYRISLSIQLLGFFFITIIIINPRNYFTCYSNGKSCSELPVSFVLTMIAVVVITILNDFTMATVGYDWVRVSKKPEHFNLKVMFIIASVLAIAPLSGWIALLVLCLAHMDSRSPNSFFQGFNIATFSYEEILTVIFLSIAISNFGTLLSARTSHWFWSRHLGWPLGLSMICGSIIAIFFAAYWPFNFANKSSEISKDMAAISWKKTWFVVGFCIVFFVLQDVSKVLAIKIIEKVYQKKGKISGISGEKLNADFLKFSTGGKEDKDEIDQAKEEKEEREEDKNKDKEKEDYHKDTNREQDWLMGKDENHKSIDKDEEI
ncbi:unnamed protein product [Blepharisma stoltei]|uniref:Plasma membrane ATPase n=1 Tax=Blepharisma stoltei TaxID=1481888 RepID=A0AAU9ISI0_9CILI|nr:unnamed protein product [Blepharisma stoltei]